MEDEGKTVVVTDDELGLGDRSVLAPAREDARVRTTANAGGPAPVPHSFLVGIGSERRANVPEPLPPAQIRLHIHTRDAEVSNCRDKAALAAGVTLEVDGGHRI